MPVLVSTCRCHNTVRHIVIICDSTLAARHGDFHAAGTGAKIGDGTVGDGDGPVVGFDHQFASAQKEEQNSYEPWAQHSHPLSILRRRRLRKIKGFPVGRGAEIW